ncbi:MAG TPA: helix-turn-helix transcriptional regulator [Candidatus Limnocylindrales bacterium]|nr:helix-turn-helix transcriptional regulator [Candidatus Limnocylindrales bacterium]
MDRLSRLLPRPLALAHTRKELPFAALCLMVQAALFYGDLVEPRPVVVGILTLIPILTAVWLASDRVALLVALTGLLFLILTGVTGVVVWFTVGAEVLTYAVTALLLRLYATAFAGQLAQRPGRPFQGRGLTRREGDVARLAAQGYTAREIGERLFIGERTVETHLAHAYVKLGVRSKSELIRISARLDREAPGAGSA